MAQIIFETDQAIFRFDAQLIIDHLQHLSRDHNRQNLHCCIDKISTDKAVEINVQTTPNCVFPIAIDLLEQGKGQVFCKPCGRAYEPRSLSLFPIGFGKSPFDVTGVPHNSFFNRLFSRKRRMPGMFGGKGFRCPAGHELIAVTTWIT
jgi:hypothetical protein